jgi:glycosyltransferase involved in cell wall biosynthesis
LQLNSTVKRIGLFLETPPYAGGTFQYCQSLLDALAALPCEHFEIVVVYTSDVWRDHLVNYTDVKTVKISRGFLGRVFGLAWLIMGLPMGIWRKLCPLFHPMAKSMLRQNCDLWIFPAHDLRSYQYPVPALVAIHDLMFRYEKRFPESASGWEYLTRDRSCRHICRWSKGVLVDSEIGKRQMVESYGIAAERVFTLPFIAPGYMHSTEMEENFDVRYQLPAKYLFYPAQFWEHKNHKNLLEAVARLKGELPDLKLVLAGSKKNAYGAVLKLVENLDLASDVIFLGYVPDEDMPELYRRALALVMPTYYGPTNIPPLEAFAIGCPVAISGLYGMPEQAGGAALHFNPDSIDEITSCVRNLWSDARLRAELAEKGKAMAGKWGQAQFNERFREIVTTLLAEKGNRL